MKRTIKFIQIGTSVANDDVFEKVKDCDIELGILVEPIPKFKEEILQCYDGIDNIYLEQVAIVSENSDQQNATLFCSDTHLGIASFNKDHLIVHRINDADIYEINTPCLKVSDIFEKYDIQELDYLFIDTEGSDADILLSIDFAKVNITEIVFEDIHIDGPQKFGGNKTRELFTHLMRSGYTLTKEHKWNTTAKLQHKITTCISTNNNLEYLKLAVQSVRQNAYYKNMPIIVYAENCTDGTDEWLADNEYDIEYYIEKNDTEKGIGGGMDFCVDKAKTEFVNIIHSDMWIAPNQDLELLKLYTGLDPNERLIASSFRIQPKIFPNDPDYRPGTVFVPMNEFGAYHNDFDSKYFDEWSLEFCEENDIFVRKGGGAGFFCRKRDYEWIGGNDPQFAPASWEDKDLFIRMQLEGYTFKMTSKSVVWHFSARGSHFRDEAKDDFSKKSQRQIRSEQFNSQKFINKWGRLPEDDEQTFVKPIYGTNVKTRLGSYEDKFNSAISQ